MALNGIKDRITVCRGGEVVNISDWISITMLPSLHGKVILGMVPYPGEISADAKLPLRAKDYKVGQVFSPKIEMGGKSFLHVGSAGFIESSLKGHRCDVVFLCVPGWKRMNGYPQRILELTGAKTVVLFHQDDFFSPIESGARIKSIALADVGGLIKKIRSFSGDIEIIVPSLYETMEF
jgi:L-ascorbate metabolism protein UlaG (beta-lactamase superfamily)